MKMEIYDESLVSNAMQSPERKIESMLNQDNDDSLELFTTSLIKTESSTSPERINSKKPMNV